MLAALALLASSSPLWAARVVVGVALPPLVVEPVPPPPVHGYYVWRPGYWSWNGVRYVWMPGVYLRPPYAGAVWVPGHWVGRRRGWVWVGGRWRP